jgi:hypothetical protein
MKKFILMFLACLLLSTTFVYSASVIKSAYFNEGLKLTVNGSEADIRFITVELEGEQYGRNYVSVADFVKALNDYAGLDATVDFDSKSQTIIIDTNVTTPAAITTPVTKTLATTETATQDVPPIPNDKLSDGMEWVWYEHAGGYEWSIKYNDCIYLNEFAMEYHYGFRTNFRIITEEGKKGTIIILGDEQYISSKNSSMTIPFNEHDTNQAIINGHYVNITWLLEVFKQ